MKKERHCGICRSIIWANSYSVEHEFEVHLREGDDLTHITGVTSICSTCMSRGDRWVGASLQGVLKDFIRCEESMNDIFRETD